MMTMNSEKLKAKREELLAYTVSFYNSSNRAEEDDVCKYITSDSKRRCPIGKLIPKKLAIHVTENYADIGINNPYIFEMMPMKVKKLEQVFLVKLQQLHDKKNHWAKQGLTVKGAGYVSRICNLFDLDVDNVFKKETNG